MYIHTSMQCVQHIISQGSKGERERAGGMNTHFITNTLPLLIFSNTLPKQRPLIQVLWGVWWARVQVLLLRLY